MPVPKNLHFIWVGLKILPDQNIDRIRKWMNLNPGLKFTLWVDKQGTERELLSQYTEIFASELKNQQLTIKDITEENVSSDAIRYEIDRMRPNYGAASDLLRYNILPKFGGAYYDFDIDPPEKENALLEVKEIWEEKDDTKFYITDFKGGYANDLIICAPNNKIMKEIRDLAHQNYLKCTVNEPEAKDESDELHTKMDYFIYQVYWANDSGYILQGTIQKTGPLCYMVPIRKEENVEQVIRIKEESLRVPLNVTKSAASWTNRGVKKFETLKAALDCTMKEIRYEVNNPKILRLDDYIFNLQRSFALETNVDLKTIINALLSRIEEEKLDFNGLKAVQLTFLYPEVEAFCRKNGLLEKAHVFPFKGTAARVKDVITDGHQPVDNNPNEQEDAANLRQGKWNFLLKLTDFYDRQIQEEKDLDDEFKYRIQEALVDIKMQLKVFAFITPLDKLKQNMLKFVGDYSSGWKSKFFGHHHEDRARAIKNALMEAKGYQDIDTLLKAEEAYFQARLDNKKEASGFYKQILACRELYNNGYPVRSLKSMTLDEMSGRVNEALIKIDVLKERLKVSAPQLRR